MGEESPDVHRSSGTGMIKYELEEVADKLHPQHINQPSFSARWQNFDKAHLDVLMGFLPTLIQRRFMLSAFYFFFTLVKVYQ